MLDRTIPFYNMILKCEKYDPQETVLPGNVQIVSYRPGFKKNWAYLEYLVGDFESEKDAKEYFCSKYLTTDTELEDLLFLVEGTEGVFAKLLEENGIKIMDLSELI